MLGEPISGRRTDQERRRGNQHPRTGDIVTFFQQVIDRGGPVPTYKAIGKRFGGVPALTVYEIARRNDFQDRLRELRRNPEIAIFPQTKETAWLLGMLFGHSGSASLNPTELKFTGNDPYKLDAFKKTGEAILGRARPGIRAEVRRIKSNVNTSVVFYSVLHAEELGDFRKRSKPDTVRERHRWVLDQPYLDSFASGVFDSSGLINWDGTKRQIDFFTSHQEVADFYRQMLLRLGLTNPRLVKDNSRNNEIIGVRIQNAPDLNRFAQKITSVNPQTQERLDMLKTLENRKRRFAKPTSAVELVKEWQRMTELLGHSPRSYEITQLKNDGQTSYPNSVYIRYFGTDDKGGPNRFVKASARLNRLAKLDEEALERETSGIIVRQGWRSYSDEDLIQEWIRIKQQYLQGGTPTKPDLVALYNEGKTEIYFKQFMRYFGANDSGRISFSRAQHRLEEIVAERLSSETQVYPKTDL